MNINYGINESFIKAHQNIENQMTQYEINMIHGLISEQEYETQIKILIADQQKLAQEHEQYF